MKPISSRVSIRVQLLALFGLLMLTGFTVLLLDEINLRADITTFNRLRDDSLSGLRMAKSISDAYGLDIVDTTFRVRNNLMGWDQGVEVVDSAREGIERDWKSLLGSSLPPEQRVVIDEVAKDRISADHAAQKLRDIMVAKDADALGKFADTELYPSIDPVTSRFKFLADLKMLGTEREVREHIASARRTDWWRIVLSLITLTVVTLVGRSILRDVYRGVESLVRLAQGARDHNFVAPGKYTPEGELGEVHDALLAMRHDLLTYETSLLESEARAQAASKAKSSFLAAMSHEIRTPMVGVAGMLELLAQTPLDSDQREQVEIVQNSARSLLQIIGDILDFSKIEAGKLELDPAPIDLRLLVRASTNNFLATASAKALKLECSIDERIAPAHLGDAMRLRQILSNFLSNALKFTERGGVQVRLERLAGEGQRELIALRVRDTGIGITAADQALLFQPFAQTRDGGARHQDSTGLGLSICQHLAGLMGGEITLESQAGSGTTFSLIVRLPLADAGLLANTVQATLVAPSRIAPSVADAEREGSLILLVDDHPTNRAVIARQLNQLGYACETANDGEAGLQAWRSGRYALLLTDLHMPRRDGHSLAAAIRSDEQSQHRPRAPVIALSANVSTEEVERSRTAGIDDFLAKPASLAVLAAALQRYLPLIRFAGTQTGFIADDIDAPRTDARLPAMALSELTRGDTALEQELIADFVHSTRQDFVALQAALARNDADAVARESHRIKGASGLVGAVTINACATRIEAAARAHDLAPVPAHTSELGIELNRFAAAHRISDEA
jgi:signal transduction histidine kinase/CheY-like chemotaxis protein/HPt (histidine-containing phosphotransfer) domain-containing protein